VQVSCKLCRELGSEPRFTRFVAQTGRAPAPSHSGCVDQPRIANPFRRATSEMLDLLSGYSTPTMRSSRFLTAAFLFLAVCTQMPSLSWAASRQMFRADEWITECDVGANIGPSDCAITVPFWQTPGNAFGSFALVVMLQTGNLGIVGQPLPLRAVLRVDKNPPIECRQARYCVFSSAQAFAVIKQLKVGSLILVDVYTTKGTFNFSLTPKGFQAGVAQIRAWGHRTEPLN
jgi:hypothetical protein